MVNLLLAQALRDRASDVHVEPMGDTVRVRFRIDGVLHDVVALPGSMGGAMVSRLKVLAGMNIVERRRPQDGQIAMTVDGRALDIRVATTGTVAGEKVVLRLLDKSRPMYQLSDLGLPDQTLDESDQPGPLAVRHGDLRRPDRQRQDHQPVRDAVRAQLAPSATS